MDAVYSGLEFGASPVSLLQASLEASLEKSSLQKSSLESSPQSLYLGEEPSKILDKRDCVVCSTSPTCPSCDDGYYCSYTVQTCDSCPKGICVANDDTTSSSSTPSSSASSSGSGGSNTGAIAGGVVAGIVVFLGLTAFLLWKYVYSAKAKEKQVERERVRMLEQSNYDGADVEKAGGSPGGPGGDAGGAYNGMDMPNNRYSSTTVSTVTNSNGDNVIPIAYIPGVISRAGADNNVNTSDRYFSASSILRDSQYTNNDIRSSIATTNYRGSVVFASEPVTVSEAKPNLIHLDSSGGAKSKNIANLTVDTDQGIGRSLSTYSTASSNSPVTPIYIQSAQTLDISQRQNARSVRLGRLRSTLGLQSQLIEEDVEAEAEEAGDIPAVPSVEQALAASASQKNEDSPLMAATKSQSQADDMNQPQANTKGATSTTTTTGTTTTSPELDVRISTFSGFDVPFVIDGNNGSSSSGINDPRNSANVNSAVSNASSRRTSTRSNSRANSRANSRTNSKVTSGNAHDSVYIADLPLDALVNAQSALNGLDRIGAESAEGSGDESDRRSSALQSPFDDKYVI